MATTNEFINYVCEQLNGVGEVTYKKMFGEYMVYVNAKPILTVCDNTVYIKKLDCIEELMQGASLGCPYEGTKEHYILDIDDTDFSKGVVIVAEKAIPLPKKKEK